MEARIPGQSSHGGWRVDLEGCRGGAIRISSILDISARFGRIGYHGREPDVLGHELINGQRLLNIFRGWLTVCRHGQ